MRTGTCLLALLLAGCGPAGGAGTGARPGAPGDRVLDVPAAVVRVDGPRSLELTWTGSPPGRPPCGSTPAVSADERPDRVVLTVREQAQGSGDGPCTSLGFLWALPVALRAELGDRAVVGADGQPLRVVRLPDLDPVPAGYAPTHAAPDARAWATPAGDLLALAVPAEEEPAGYGRVARAQVCGTPARVLRAPGELAVRWRAGGRELRLSSSGPDGPLSVAELLRVACDVRPG